VDSAAHGDYLDFRDVPMTSKNIPTHNCKRREKIQAIRQLNDAGMSVPLSRQMTD
jgi:hypothetical protein